MGGPCHKAWASAAGGDDSATGSTRRTETDCIDVESAACRAGGAARSIRFTPGSATSRSESTRSQHERGGSMLAPVRPAAFVGARLLDGRSPDAIANGVLVTDDRGRISVAGAVAGVKAPRDVERIDATGLTILPGIIDCHVHLSLRLEPVADQVQRSATDLVVRALETGRDFLDAGVTTIRDAGYTPAGIKRAFASGAFPGPRTQASSTPPAQTGVPGRGGPAAAGTEWGGRRAGRPGPPPTG